MFRIAARGIVQIDSVCIMNRAVERWLFVKGLQWSNADTIVISPMLRRDADPIVVGLHLHRRHANAVVQRRPGRAARRIPGSTVRRAGEVEGVGVRDSAAKCWLPFVVLYRHRAVIRAGDIGVHCIGVHHGRLEAGLVCEDLDRHGWCIGFRGLLVGICSALCEADSVDVGDGLVEPRASREDLECAHVNSRALVYVPVDYGACECLPATE